MTDDEIDGFLVSGEGRFFATDNFKLSLKGGFSTLESEEDFSVDTFTVGGGAEYRFDSTPLSAFVNVDFSQSEVDDVDDDFSDVRVMAGLKLNLGTQTLIERDRTGASLDPVKPSVFGLPLFGIGGPL